MNLDAKMPSLKDKIIQKKVEVEKVEKKEKSKSKKRREEVVVTSKRNKKGKKYDK